MPKVIRVPSLAPLSLCLVLLSGCATPPAGETVFNEMLGTVLRGILIKGAIADKLEVTPGYYRVNEFRVAGTPSHKAIVFSIHKPYATYVAPDLSVLPLESEEFVFSTFTNWVYDSTGRQATVSDQRGHILEFKIKWGPLCSEVEATLDEIAVPMSTQSYAAQTLNSCGWEAVNEDSFTVPN